MVTLLELSVRTHQTLSNPTSPTVGVISYWYRHHVGELNSLINTSYAIDLTDGTIEPDLTEVDAAIFQKMYMVYFYDTKIRENLGAAAIDPVLEVAENGAVVRLTSRNEISKSYIQMKKQEQEELNKLITFYRMNNSIPQSVDGDDTVEGWYNGIFNQIRTKTS